MEIVSSSSQVLFHQILIVELSLQTVAVGTTLRGDLQRVIDANELDEQRVAAAAAAFFLNY